MNRIDEKLLHLVKKANPKLLTATHWAIKVLLALSLFLVFREPHYLEPYLLVGALVGLQFVLVYIEFLQRGNGPKG